MRQTFILKQKKWFRWTIRVFLKSAVEDKIDQRNIVFTTEHKVTEKERNRNARRIAAEFSTSDEVLIDALYRDSGYGSTFVHVDDPEGKRKKHSFNVTPLDAKKIALKNLFQAIGLAFDEHKSVEVLTEEYQIHVSAKTGVLPQKGEAVQIPIEMVNVEQEMVNQAESARKIYEDKYGDPIPGDFINDKGFLSAILSDPKWDAQEYIAEQTKEVDDGELPDTAQELWPIYKEVFGKNVANIKKNDAGWIKAQIESKRKE